MNKQMNWINLKNSMTISLKINGMVMWILMGGGCYSALVTASGTGKLVTDVITSLSLGPTGTVFIMITLAFILGMFIDPVAIVMICVPIFMAIAKAMGLDLLWVMLLVVVSVIIGYISPPFGVNLFYMKGVAPTGTKIQDVYIGVMPFVIIKVMVLLMGLFIPAIYLFLPAMIMK
ncbi:MAG TPA: TRAP transporter large permease subunit [Saprospiraceae bacterium]|nr:TRAP transporter large permease subunit [Saprospiraceae bacterium]